MHRWMSPINQLKPIRCRRTWSRILPFAKVGGCRGFETWKNFVLRLLLMPSFFFLLWIFYYEGFRVSYWYFPVLTSCIKRDYNSDVTQNLPIVLQSGTTKEEQYQRTFVTRNGLVFSSLTGAYFISIIITACTFASERTRYYQVSI